MPKTTHTRRGTCQVCGAIQAIDNNTDITAKHGYKVAGYGFFAGVCPGARHASAEKSLDVTHAIITQLEAAALTHDAEAAAYRNRTKFCTVYVEWDFSVIKTITPSYGTPYVSRGAYVERTITPDTPVHIVDHAQTKAATIAEQNARYARQHVSMIRNFIIPCFGQPFKPPFKITRVAVKAKVQP